MNSDVRFGICVWLFEIGSTRCSECDSRWALDVESTHCSEWGSCHSEKARIVNSKLSFGFHALFGWDREYSLQQVRFSLERVGSSWKARVVRVFRYSEVGCPCSELVGLLQQVCMLPQREVTALWQFDVQHNCWDVVLICLGMLNKYW